MRTIVILVCCCVSYAVSSGLCAQEANIRETSQDRGLRLAAYFIDVQNNGGDRTTYCYSFLENVGNEKLKIVVGEDDSIHEVQDQSIKIFAFSAEKRMDGKFIKRPTSEVGIVELRPGEVTSLPRLMRTGDNFDGGLPAIRYYVDESLTDLYAAWSGELNAEPVSITLLKKSEPTGQP